MVINNLCQVEQINTSDDWSKFEVSILKCINTSGLQYNTAAAYRPQVPSSVPTCLSARFSKTNHHHHQVGSSVEHSV